MAIHEQLGLSAPDVEDITPAACVEKYCRDMGDRPALEYSGKLIS